MSMTLKVEGLEELQDSFEKVIRQFPDDAGDELRKLGLQIKKDAISAIGYYKIAKMIGVPNNRFNIQLEKVDEL